MRITGPSGTEYTWDKPTPPTDEDWKALQAFDAKQPKKNARTIWDKLGVANAPVPKPNLGAMAGASVGRAIKAATPAPDYNRNWVGLSSQPASVQTAQKVASDVQQGVADVVGKLPRPLQIVLGNAFGSVAGNLRGISQAKNEKEALAPFQNAVAAPFTLPVEAGMEGAILGAPDASLTQRAGAAANLYRDLGFPGAGKVLGPALRSIRKGPPPVLPGQVGPPELVGPPEAPAKTPKVPYDVAAGPNLISTPAQGKAILNASARAQEAGLPGTALGQTKTGFIRNNWKAVVQKDIDAIDAQLAPGQGKLPDADIAALTQARKLAVQALLAEEPTPVLAHEIGAHYDALTASAGKRPLYSIKAKAPAVEPVPTQKTPAAPGAPETPIQAPEVPARKAGRTRADALDDFNRKLEAIKAKKGAGGPGAFGGEQLSDLLEAGTYLVEAGVRGSAEWTAQMVKHFGDAVRPHLSQLYLQAHAKAEDPVSRFHKAITEAEPLGREEWDVLQKSQRAAQTGKSAALMQKAMDAGENPLSGAYGGAKGKFPRPDFKPIEVHPDDLKQLRQMALDHPGFQHWDQVHTLEALDDALSGKVPTESGMRHIAKVYGPDVVDGLLTKRTTGNKVVDFLLALKRFNLISGPGILGKMTSSAAATALTAPVEDLLGASLRKTAIGKAAPWEAGSAGAGYWKVAKGLIKHAAEFDSGSAGDAWAMLKTGENELSTKFGSPVGGVEQAANGKLGFIGRLHGAIMTPLQRLSYLKSIGSRMDAFAKSGTAPSIELVEKAHLGAYQDSLQAVFRNDNQATALFQEGIKAASSSKLGRPLTKLAQAELAPIFNVPSNVVGRTAEYTGLPAAYNTLKLVTERGFSKLAPEDAAKVLRAYKRGGIGAGLMGLGYLAPHLMDWLPASMKHTPAFQAYNMGQTAHDAGSFGEGATKIMGGLAQETPVLGNTVEDAHRFLRGSWDEKGKVLGQHVQGYIPLSSAAGYVARTLDKPGGPSLTGDTNQRAPKGFWDELFEGVPVMRETVPLRGRSLVPKPPTVRVPEPR